MRTTLPLLLAGCACAQSVLDQPRLGIMLDQQGAARPVRGVAASVTIGDAAATGVNSFACSKDRCLFKTDTSVTDGNRSVDAPPGFALFAFDRHSALVYFSGTKQLMRWSGGSLDPVAFESGDEILALRVTSFSAIDIAVRRDRGVAILRVSLTVGQTDLRGQWPDATGPAILLADGALLATADNLVLRRDDGTELRFRAPGARQFFVAGDGLIQIRTDDGVLALGTTPGRELLFQLPEPQP
jgi:hypothetical protein